MDSITTQLKAETEELMWKYLAAHKQQNVEDQKRLYGEIMLMCRLIEAEGSEVVL